jgi:hypothetical protein
MPNNMPNDFGHKSLAAHVWQTRQAVLKGSEKPKKDAWDKADIVIKGVIGGFTVIAAVLVAVIGGKIQQAVTSQTGKIQESIATQNTGKDYIGIALGILGRKDLSEDMKKNIGLRKWAVGLLKYYSPVTLDEPTADKLINGEVEFSMVYSNWQQTAWGPPDPSSTFQAVLPHNHGFASLNTDGVLRVRAGAQYTAQTGIKSPKGLFFTPDGNTGSEILVVFNDQTFALYFTRPDLSRGQPGRVIPPIRISPPNGISTISTSLDGNIIVTGTDNKQVVYDLDGNEIKQ